MKEGEREGKEGGTERRREGKGGREEGRNKEKREGRRGEAYYVMSTHKTNTMEDATFLTTFTL